MSTTTTNLSLLKPAGADLYTLTGQFNDNWDNLDGRWASTTPSTQAFADAAAAGASLNVARANHKHEYPSFGSSIQTVVTTTESDGVATTPARSDHVHATPDGNTFAAPSSVGAANAAGSAVTTSRSDHVHTIAADTVTDTMVAAANKDGATGTASFRTLGTGAAQAAAGNHGHAAFALLDEETLAAGAASITLTVTAGYTHLLLQVHARSTEPGGSGDSLRLRFNGDSGANYDRCGARNNGGVALFDQAGETGMNLGSIPANTSTSGRAAGLTAWIPCHAQTTLRKGVLAQMVKIPTTTAADFDLFEVSGMWRSTAEITSVTVLTDSGSNLAVGTRASLYGFG